MCLPMLGDAMNDFGGIDPPTGLINPDYKQEPSNPRKCIECGKMHDTIVEDTTTGKRLSEIEKCKDCFMSGVFSVHQSYINDNNGSTLADE